MYVKHQKLVTYAKFKCYFKLQDQQRLGFKVDLVNYLLLDFKIKDTVRVSKSLNSRISGYLDFRPQFLLVH